MKISRVKRHIYHCNHWTHGNIFNKVSISCLSKIVTHRSWWHQEMEALSAMLALCEGNPWVEFTHKWPVMRIFDVSFVKGTEHVYMTVQITLLKWDHWVRIGPIWCQHWADCVPFLSVNGPLIGKLPTKSYDKRVELTSGMSVFLYQRFYNDSSNSFDYSPIDIKCQLFNMFNDRLC